ncbi:MAG: SAM-dependent chlorinase/fluorinase [Gammaproteobacteria bacterium]|nr:SAM-dependent chlorinase/fluorinase [Gammaproteobacteria bacterium]
MIVIATDFGNEGPYLGQMKAVLLREAPAVPVLDLFANLPSFAIQPAAYLLAAYVDEFPDGTVFLCVVDPGVGGARAPVVLRADGRWYVGPDNGLFNVIAQRAASVEWWNITWRPDVLSRSFHGRDLFAPVAARIARGDAVPGVALDPAARTQESWPSDLAQVIYIDNFGNAMTGIRAEYLDEASLLETSGYLLRQAGTFSDVQPGTAFWYGNANGLVEIAVNQGRADRILGLHVGDRVHFRGRL